MLDENEMVLKIKVFILTTVLVNMIFLLIEDIILLDKFTRMMT